MKRTLKYADDNQANLYKKFSSTHYLGNSVNVDHVYLWCTFFRRNLHRFAMDYLGLQLHLYQQLILYMMGICNFIVIIASRAAAKSFIIAIWACCRAILYPGSQIVLSSATRGQSKLIVTEKIQGFLMGRSEQLRQEIEYVRASSNNEVRVGFRNKSVIIVVTADESGRGNRSTGIVREEFRQIKKSIDDSILSPFQVMRQQPYMFLEPYSEMKKLEELPVDIYISSSWFDNGHWMWTIVDKAYDEMMEDRPSCLLAFDESIVLKHRIKSLEYLIGEKKKQDPLTWRIEFLNERVRENTFAFFSYDLITKNCTYKHVFYPRLDIDIHSGKKNPYYIPLQPNEIRILSADMAFIENEKNDNSIFSIIRLLPETTSYTVGENDTTEIQQGYRRIVCYMESIQGGDTQRQSIRLKQLFYDANCSYLVLDTRNCGIGVYDQLARVQYDESRGIEYPAWRCMNDEGIANRIKIPSALECVYAINASQKLNSDIAFAMRKTLEDRKIEFLVPFKQAEEEILKHNKNYVSAAEAEMQLFYERPFLETQQMVAEMTDLVYEKKEQTGVIVIHEQGNNRKDRYTSVSYGNWFANLLEQDLLSNGNGYEYCCLVN